ncbi:malectin domain-containing carbohydrate-binding protein [Pontibacter chitinilyticus]|uniref:malectin domain-containing carbohydrate-binding protein n=1 Tax=Pontibacter chitinilyticus TaxID=2674989 RepID=UPI00321C2B26
MFPTTPYVFSVSADAAVGSLIGTVEAQDADSDALTYTITAGNDAGLFEIKSGTNEISVSGLLSPATYTLTVTATEATTDPPLAASTDVTITVEEAPVAGATLVASASALQFGAQEIGAASAAQTVTLTNTEAVGGASISISNIASDNSAYIVVPNPATAVLAPGETFTFEVSFNPAVAGEATGTISITHDGADSPTLITVAGEGQLAANQSPQVAVAPLHQNLTTETAFSFSAGSFTDPDGDVLTYTATRDDETALPSWLVFNAQELTFSGTAPAAAEEVAVKVTATDASAASVSTSFTITVQAPEVVVASLVADPASLSFNAQVIGTSSATQTISLIHSGAAGSAAINITSVTSDNGDFVVSALPDMVVSPSAVGRVNVSFNPKTTGAASGIITITHTGANSPLQIALSGEGAPVPVVACTPISTLPCDQLLVSLPVRLEFTGLEGGLQDKNGAGLGFTMVDPPSARIALDGTIYNPSVPGYEPARLVLANDQLKINAAKGISFLKTTTSTNTNSQINTLGVAFAAAGSFDVSTEIVNPYSDATINSEQAGVWFGLNEDNYVKLVAVNGGVLEMRVETAGASADATNRLQANVANLNTSVVTLRLRVDVVQKTVKGYYKLNNGTEVAIGSLAITDALINKYQVNGTAASFAGIFTTKRNEVATVAVEYTFNSFSLTPAAANQAPVVASAPLDQILTGGSLISFSGGSFTDADNDALTYKATLEGGGALPVWLTYNTATQQFSGTAPLIATNLRVTVTATDPSAAAAAATFAVTVNPPAQAPSFTKADEFDSYGEGALKDMASSAWAKEASSATGSEAQLRQAKISLAGNLTSAYSVDFSNVVYTYDNKAITATPLVIQANQPFYFGTIFKVSQIGSLADSRIRSVIRIDGNTNTSTTNWVRLQVGKTNGQLEAQVGLGGLSEVHFRQNVAADEALQLVVKGIWNGNGTIDYWVAVNPVFNEQQVNWTKVASTHTVNKAPVIGRWFISSANAGNIGSITAGRISTDYTNVVIPEPVAENNAPVFAAASYDFSVAETAETGTTIGAVAANDADNEPLTYTITSGNEAGKFAIDATGAITVASALTQTEPTVYALSVTASDGKASAFTQVNISVTETIPANHSPEVAVALADQAIEVGEAFTFTLPEGTFTDADQEDALTYTASLETGNALPAWLAFDGSSFSGTPTEAATYQIMVTASDGKARVADVFTLAVKELTQANRTPQVAVAPQDQNLTTETAFSFSAGSFTDPDGDVLTYTATRDDETALPSWLVFNAQELTFSGTAPAAAEEVAVKVTATDASAASVSTSFTITVSPGVTTVAALGTSNEAVNFAEQTIGIESTAKTITFTHLGEQGSGDITINSVAVTGNAFNLAPFTTPVTLSAGQTATVNIFFNPTVAGETSGSLVVTHNGENGSLTIPLTGVGVGCPPNSILPCDQVVASLPVQLEFGAAAGGLVDKNGIGTGFTMALAHSGSRLTEDQPVSNAIVNGYEPAKISVLNNNLVVSANKGIAYLNNNAQVNTLGVGLRNLSKKFSIETTLLNVPAFTGSAQEGIWFGIDDKNFIKLDVNSNSNVRNIELRREVNDGSSSTTADQLQLAGAFAVGQDVKLRLEIDPIAKVAKAYYTVGTGAETLLVTTGISTLALPDSYFAGTNGVSYAGLYATYRNGSTFNALFDYFTVKEATPVNNAPVFATTTYNFNVVSTAAEGAEVGTIAATDADQDALSYTFTTGNEQNLFAIDANGKITVAAALSAAQHVLTVSATDGKATATATININVTDVAQENTAPVALADAATAYHGTPVLIDVLANDTDTDGTLNVTTVTVTTQPEQGTAVVDATGKIRYTPATLGTYTFSYTVADDKGTVSEPALVTVTTGIKVNFQDMATVPPAEYLKDYGQGFGVRTDSNQGTGLSYGWKDKGDLNDGPLDLTLNGRNRITSTYTSASQEEKLRGTLLHMQGGDPAGFTGNTTEGKWEIKVPNGRYRVAVGVGDPSVDSKITDTPKHSINVEGVAAIIQFVPAGTVFNNSGTRHKSNTVVVDVADELLTIDAFDGFNTKISSVVITPTTEPAAGTLAFAPNPLEFNGLTGSAASSKTVALTGTPAAAGTTPKLFATAPDWLTVPAGAFGDLSFTAIPGALPSGTYNTEVTARAVGYLFTKLPVILNLSDPQNTEAVITTFALADATGTINTTDHTIAVSVAPATDLTNLKATFSLSTGAVATVGDVVQVSGETANDFTNALTYTVTAQDGTTTQEWVVSVTKEDVLANLEATPSELAFTGQMLGTTSGKQTITLRHIGAAGSAAITLGQVSATNEAFVATAPAVTTLAPGESTTVDVTFTPAAVGPITAKLVLLLNAEQVPFEINLLGTGEAAPAACAPISTLPCTEIAVSLPFNLNFTGDEGKLANTGFTMVDAYSAATRNAADGTPSSDVRGFEPSKLSFSNGTLQFVTSKGIAFVNNNNQLNSLGVALDASQKLTLETTLIHPFNGTQSEQAGLWMGLNDKTFLKLVVTGNKVELRRELNDVSSTVATNNPDQRMTPVISGLDNQIVRLRLVVDPVAQTAEAFYSVDGIVYTNVGEGYTAKAVSIAGMNITVNGAYAGIQATHRNATAPVTYTFENFSVTPEQAPANRAPVVAVAPKDQQLAVGDAFSFSAGSFTDPDGDEMTFTATLADGSALPAWLTFNAANLTFSGTAPATTTTLAVKVTATDVAGEATGATFAVVVKESVPVVACSEISTLPCPEILVNLNSPYILNFGEDGGGLADKAGVGTGFRMVDKPSARLAADGPVYMAEVPGYEPSRLEVVNGQLKITTNRGIAYLKPTGTGTTSPRTNSQINALGVGLNATTQKFTIEADVVNPYVGAKAEQAGLWYGLDEDNFVKIVVSNGIIEMRRELGAVSGQSAADVVTSGTTAIANISTSTVKLKLLVDNAAGTVTGFYAINGGAEIQVGGATAIMNIPALIAGKTVGEVANMSFAGVFATHRNAGDPNFGTLLNPPVYSFDNFKVEAVTPVSNVLAFTPSSLSFSAGVGTTVAAQTATLNANQGTPNVTLSKSADSDWLTLPASGMGALNFAVSTTGLAPGTYMATVTAAAPDYTNATLTVNLTITSPEVVAQEIRVNFQDPNTVPPTGWVRDYGQAFGSRTGQNQGSGLIYGWRKRSDGSLLDLSVGGSTPGNGRNRGVPSDVLLATLMHMQANQVSGTFNGTPIEGYWEVKVPNGIYDVTVSAGDGSVNQDTEIHSINVEGVSAIKGFVPSGTAGSLTRFQSAKVRVTVTDDYLTINADGGTNTKINSALIVPVSTDPYLYWSANSQTLVIEKGTDATDKSFSLELNKSNSQEDVQAALSVNYGEGPSGWLSFNASHNTSEPNVTFDYTAAKDLELGTYTATVSASANGFTSAGFIVKVTVVDPSARPYVISSTPADGATGVALNPTIAANSIYVPEVPGFKGGVDNATITSSTVQLFKVSGGSTTSIIGTVQGTGGGDAISFSPSFALEPNTTYKFVITDGVKSYSGAQFMPYEASFTTGSASTEPTGPLAVEFKPEAIPGTQGKKYTSLTFGPDGKFYALRLDGTIERFNVDHVTGQLSGMQELKKLVNTYGNRSAVGLTFDPAATADNLIVWVSHCSSGLDNAPEFDGKISKLTGSNLENEQLVLTKLPRSKKDHLVNSIAFGPDGALYFNQGSCSSMGAYDGTWQRNETLLSGAVLRLDVDKLNGLPLPLDVQTTANQSLINAAPANSITMADGTYNPYATNSPLTIYASGVRNAFDLVWHSNGQLYVPANGSAAGGNTPVSVLGTRRPDGTFYDGPAIPATTSVQVQRDWLFRINPSKPVGFYGHPNPLRGQYVANRGYADDTKYPAGTVADVSYRGAAFDFEYNKSPNGALEYKSNAFGGALKGWLLVCRFSGGSDIIALKPGAMAVGADLGSDAVYDIVDSRTGSGTNGIPGFSNLSNPLDITEDVETGNIYVIEYNWNNTAGKATQITLLKATTPSAPTAVATVTPGQVIDNVVVNTTGVNRTVTIANTGNATLTISGIALEGVNASQFRLSGVGSMPLTVAQNSATTFNVAFTPTSTGVKEASLRISSTGGTDKLVQLKGLGTAGLSGTNEPSLQAILNLYGLKINVGDDDVNTNIINSSTTQQKAALLGDEVAIQKFERAVDGPVTVEPLAVFGPQDAQGIVTGFGWYTSGDANAKNQLFTVANSDYQTVRVNAVGNLSFDPGIGSFGFYSHWPYFADRHLYSEDALNTFTGAIPHHVRVYPLKNADGVLVENAYVIATEEHVSGFDFQDVVVIVRNVRPAGQVVVNTGNRINAGGPQFTDSQSQSWSADAAFVGGAVSSKTFDVQGTTDDALYLTYRYATPAATAGSPGTPFSYSIPVSEPGEYNVKLHFLEPYFGAPGGVAGTAGARVFHVDLEGQRVLSNYDIFAQDGAGKAVVKSFNNVSITDGKLDIAFTSIANNAIISAIEFEKVTETPPPTVAGLKVNFSDQITAAPSGWLKDYGQAFGDRGNGNKYGWLTTDGQTPLDLTLNGRNRNRVGIDLLLNTIVLMQYADIANGSPANGNKTEGIWEAELANGVYDVTVGVGDQVGANNIYDSQHTINVEGVTAIDKFQGTPAKEFEQKTVTVNVTDGRLTITAAGGTNTKITSIIVQPSTTVPTLAVTPAELIFNGVNGTTIGPKAVMLKNEGGSPLTISSITKTGPNQALFTVAGTPATLEAGETATVNVTFAPNAVGNLEAALEIASNDPAAPIKTVGLYGLSTSGFEGGNEPPLANVVKTLGYGINVGWTTLSSSMDSDAKGEEALVPLFEKAGNGNVTITPVARYSPAEELPFGWYTGAAATSLNQVGVLLGGSPNHQTLFPGLASGGSTFDPQTATFGIYVDSKTFNRKTYTEDNLNAQTNAGFDHRVRIYPMKGRDGQAVPNSYLVCFEDAENGDYQDYVFVLTNVVPAGARQTLAFTPNTLDFAVTEGGTSSAKEVTLSANTGTPGAITLTKSANSNWLLLPTAAAGKLSIGVDATGLTAGTYETTVTAAAEGYVSATMQVSLEVGGFSANSVKVNFQMASSATPTGYAPDAGLAFDAVRGYGWIDPVTKQPKDHTASMRDRTASGDEVRLRTLALMQGTSNGQTPGTWEYVVPNGLYKVSVSAGDPDFFDSRHQLNVEGIAAINGFIPTAQLKYKAVTVIVEVNDGKLTIDASGGTNTKINYVIIDTATPEGDHTAPVAVVKLKGTVQSPGVYKGEVIATVDASDAGGSGLTSVHYSLNDGPFTEYFAPIQVKEPGTYTIRAKAVDGNGNEFTSQPISFSVVKPVLSYANMVVENMDKFPAADHLTFSNVQTPWRRTDPTVTPYNENHNKVKLKISNKGAGPLVISNLTLSNTSGWKIAQLNGVDFDATTALPVTVNTGSAVEATIEFIAKDLGGRVKVLHDTLYIASNDDLAPYKKVKLHGLWQNRGEGSNEPYAQEIINAFGFKTKTGFSSNDGTSDGSNIVSNSDEILSSFFLRADASKPVYVIQMGAYHGCCSATESFQWYAKGSTTNSTAFTHNALDGQSLLPRKNGSTTVLAEGTFSPSTTTANPTAAFGFKVSSSYSDRTRNSEGKIGLRIWKAIDANGNIIPNAYIIGHDYIGNPTVTNYDYQDNVFYISNVKPETGPANFSELATAPSAVSIGNVMVGANKTATITLNNLGKTYPDGSSDPAIDIKRVEITGADLSDFTVGTPAAATIAPQASTTVAVGFRPGSRGIKNAALLVHYNNSLSPLRIPLYGIADDGCSAIAVLKRIKGGADASVTIAGNVWEADKSYRKGNVQLDKPAATPIAGTDDDVLYQTYLSSTGDLNEISYAVPMANGTYMVRMHFVENFWTAVGSRVFNISLENELRLSNLDIYREVGYKAALVKDFEVTVTDGVLNAKFNPSANRLALAGMEIFGVTNSTSTLVLGTKTITGSACGVPDGAVELAVSNSTATSFQYKMGAAGTYQASAVFANLAAGSYTFYARENVAGGCETSAVITVPNRDNNLAFEVSAPALACNAATGTATVSNVSGGAGNYTYAWNTAPVQTGSTATNLSPGVYTVTVTDATTGCSKSQEVSITRVDGCVVTAIRINAGGAAYQAKNGDNFMADQYFSTTNSNTYSNTSIADIGNTEDDLLYKTERSGNTDRGSFTYSIPVKNGNHTVKLHFAEIYSTSTADIGRRVMNVKVEGQTVLSNYDIIADVGVRTAVVKSYDVAVTDGVLNLEFAATANRPKVSAIEVITVSEAVNEPPVANAGTDQTITLPTSKVTLTGTGSDKEDGAKVSFAWSQLSGPNTAVIAAATQATTDVTGLVEGAYTFQLTVTDSKGAAANSTVKVTVNKPLPVMVRVNAGGTTQTVNGVTWQGCITGDCNNYVTGGFAYTQTPLPTITGAAFHDLNQSVYQTEWTGGQSGGNVVPAGATAFAYSIPVTNGQYLVRLYFTELNKTGVNLRTFDVKLEGQEVLTRFDVFAEADGALKAIYREFPVTVTDGNVSVAFIRQIENAKISAIEVVPLSEATLNTLPVANAGENRTVPTTGAQASVTLNGAASADQDGYLVSYTWSEGGTVLAKGVSPTVSLGLGSHKLTLTVKDNAGAVNSADVTVVVESAGYALTVTTQGQGVVTPSSGTYGSGTTVKLTATPEPGYMFTGWSGDASGSANPLSITMNGNKAIIATFSLKTYTVSATAGTGGAVTVNPAKTTYTQGEEVTITAIASDGYEFTGWTGSSSQSSSLVVTVTADVAVTANFRQKQYSLNATASAGGAVSVNPVRTTYTYGTTVTLTATPLTGYIFVGWSGDATGVTNPLGIVMTGDKAVTANFAPENSNPTLSTMRVNAGGSTQTAGGVTWSGCSAAGACNNYVSGGFAYTQSPLASISGVPSNMTQNIFQTEWTGGAFGGVTVPRGAVAFTYNIPVVNGSYMVRLYFTELNKNGTGLRVFDVNLEGGDKELVSFDIYKEAGGIRKVIMREFPVTIVDGNVTIDFIRQVENAKISAIEIVPAQSTANQLPIAKAGADQALLAGADGTALVSLDGSASADPDGTISSYVWKEGNSQLATGAKPTFSLSTGVHTIILTVTDNKGATASDEVVISVNPATACALPSGWLSKNIGAVGSAGDVCYSNGSYTVQGSGTDIWNTSDQFRYVYQNLSCNGEIIARVNSLTNTDPWAKAGVMIRETDATGSKHAMMVLTPGNGASFQYRTATSGSMNSVSRAAVAPQWVRITREGNVFKGYISATGQSWTLVGQATISMNSNVLIGLAVTAHNNSATASANFSNVQVTGLGCFSPIRINAGGPALTLKDGTVFSADRYFSNTYTYQNTSIADIAGTEDDQLYKTERGSNTNLGSFAYNIPVPNGQYVVKLHFAEIYWSATSIGKRVFDVNLEGGTVELPRYDIVASVGTRTAVIKEFTVSVTDGVLTINFSASADRPKISAIEVLPSAINASLLAASSDVSLNGAGMGEAGMWVKAYPNPNPGDKVGVTLANYGKREAVKVTIYTVDGRIIYAKTTETDDSGASTLDVDLNKQLSKGVYIIRATSATGSSHTKLLVN